MTTLQISNGPSLTRVIASLLTAFDDDWTKVSFTFSEDGSSQLRSAKAGVAGVTVVRCGGGDRAVELTLFMDTTGEGLVYAKGDAIYDPHTRKGTMRFEKR